MYICADNKLECGPEAIATGDTPKEAYDDYTSNFNDTVSPGELYFYEVNSTPLTIKWETRIEIVPTVATPKKAK